MMKYRILRFLIPLFVLCTSLIPTAKGESSGEDLPPTAKGESSGEDLPRTDLKALMKMGILMLETQDNIRDIIKRQKDIAKIMLDLDEGLRTLEHEVLILQKYTGIKVMDDRQRFIQKQCLQGSFICRSEYIG